VVFLPIPGSEKPRDVQKGNLAMSTTVATTPRLDAHLGKFSQASTFLLAALAFVFNQPLIVLITAIILGLSALFPAIGPYRLAYRYILVPLHLIKPHIVEDDPAPHRFAQGVGTVFLLAAWLLLFIAHASILGWVLDLIVFVLSGLNLFVGFCAGCFVYYHLGRLGITPRVRYEGSFHWRGV
jgi:hypothetical protein